MNKKKEIVPKFRFPKYVNSEQWISTELSSLLDYERPDLYIVESDNYKNEGIPVLTANKSFILGYTDEKNNIYSRVPVIIFDDFTTEKKYVDFPFKVKSSAIKILKPKGNNVLKFVFELMNTINFEAKEHKRYYISTYQKLFVYVPKDVKEQQNIADCLSSTDDLIDAESRKLKALEKYKKGLMQKLFPAEGKTLPEWRFPEFRHKNEWRIKPLGKICTNYDSRRIPITEKDRVRGEIPYIGASGVIDDINDFIFDEDLLCVSEDGANLVARTYPIAFSISGKTWVNNHAHVLKFSHKYTQDIVESYLNMINLQDFLTGMAQPKLNRAKLDIIPIPLPEEEEQQKIAGCLSDVDAMITEQSNKVEQLKAHKKGLMQGLFPSLEEADV